MSNTGISAFGLMRSPTVRGINGLFLTARRGHLFIYKGITYLVFDMRQNIRSSEEISKMVNRAIIVGTEVPKTRGGTRTVTKIDIPTGKIEMRTGVITRAKKYITKEMIQWAYNKIQSGEKFNAKDLAKEFPKEYSQGDCVFSMTGGIIVLLGVAEYSPTYKAYIPSVE